MEIDLKKENSRNTFLIIAASIVFSAFLQLGSTSMTNLIELVVVGSGSVMFSAVLLMITNILPQSVNHKFIFTRWKNELPACRVNQLCKRDSRIEYDLVKKRWPEVFEDNINGDSRNSRWYQQIYKPVKDTREVLQAHRTFLLYRDTFSGLTLIFLGTIAWSVIGDPKIVGEIKPVVFFIQGFLTVLSLIAARISGNRFVVNAVAAAE